MLGVARIFTASGMSWCRGGEPLSMQESNFEHHYGSYYHQCHHLALPACFSS